MLRKILQQAGTIGAGVAVMVVILLFLFGFNRVDEYEVGVRRNPVTGAVSPTPYRQGLYHAILRSWTNYSTREIQYPREGAAERLTALSSDQLQIGVDAAYRYRINPDSVVTLYLTVGGPGDIHSYVYNTYRSAVRDAIAEVEASNILSSDRATIGDRIESVIRQQILPAH